MHFKTRLYHNQKNSPASTLTTQLAIFAMILLLSSFISRLFPPNFPVPAPLIGFLLLYGLLSLNLIKLSQVEKLANFLINIIGLLFVPSGIQLATALPIIQSDGLKIILVIFLATIIMFFSISLTTVIFLKLKTPGRRQR